MSTSPARIRNPLTWVPSSYLAEGIPFAALTDYDVPSLYALKGEVVGRGVKGEAGGENQGERAQHGHGVIRGKSGRQP